MPRRFCITRCYLIVSAWIYIDVHSKFGQRFLKEEIDKFIDVLLPSSLAASGIVRQRKGSWGDEFESTVGLGKGKDLGNAMMLSPRHISIPLPSRLNVHSVPVRERDKRTALEIDDWSSTNDELSKVRHGEQEFQG